MVDERIQSAFPADGEKYFTMGFRSASEFSTLSMVRCGWPMAFVVWTVALEVALRHFSRTL
jgi:hypothetical protein